MRSRAEVSSGEAMVWNSTRFCLLIIVIVVVVSFRVSGREGVRK